MMDQQPTALKLLKEGKDGQAVPLTETDHKEIVAHMLLRGSELSAKQPFPQGIRHFHTDTVGKYVRDFNDNGGSFSPIKTGHHAKVACLLDSAGVRSQFEEYVDAQSDVHNVSHAPPASQAMEGLLLITHVIKLLKLHTESGTLPDNWFELEKESVCVCLCWEEVRRTMSCFTSLDFLVILKGANGS